jgi:hypothetical protein
MHIPLITALVATTVLVAPEASAKIEQWKKSEGGNGHRYEAILVARNINGIEALVRASARGCGWHLATITSRAEDLFVFSLIQEDERFFREEHGPWIGGVQANANDEPAGNWQWVTGERFAYTNWQSGEPNNTGGLIPYSLQELHLTKRRSSCIISASFLMGNRCHLERLVSSVFAQRIHC